MTATTFETDQWADLAVDDSATVSQVRAKNLTVAVIANDDVTETGVTIFDGKTFVVTRPANRGRRTWHGSAVASDAIVTVPAAPEPEAEWDAAAEDTELLLVGITTSVEYVAAVAAAEDASN
jgi:hypothetical protein